MTKPYRAKRFGILNHVGDLWTPDTFQTEAEAKAYIRSHWLGDKLSRHKVVPVRVTVSVITKPTTQEAASTPAPGDVAQQNPLQGPSHDR